MEEGGGGGYAARLFILFPFPCSADHERDWPPCKVAFFGLASNTLNVRNNNYNNNNCLECRQYFSSELHTTETNVAFRRKALFVEGVSEFVKGAGI